MSCRAVEPLPTFASPPGIISWAEPSRVDLMTHSSSWVQLSPSSTLTNIQSRSSSAARSFCFWAEFGASMDQSFRESFFVALMMPSAAFRAPGIFMSEAMPRTSLAAGS